MRRSITLPTAKRNVLAVYRQATLRERKQGRNWYRQAHLDLRAQSPDVAPDLLAAVCAVLSPMTRWELNLEMTGRIFAEPRLTRRIDGKCREFVDLKGYTAFPANVRKARLLREGGSIDANVTGEKVRAFYELLRDPDNPREVCLDSIGIFVALGVAPTPFTTSEDAKPWFDRPAQLRIMRQAFVEVAEERGVLPNHVQATTWLVWRGERDRQ